MTLRAGVFLDRDGTIVEDVGYCKDPSLVRLLPGAAEAIGRLNRAGVPAIVISNQSGIGRGMLSASNVEAVHRAMAERLARAGARVDAIYCCPHHPDDACACRKPRIALLEQAARTFGLALDACYMVGDKDSDVETARAMGGCGIRIRAAHAATDAAPAEADHVVNGLPEAVSWILEQERKRCGDSRGGLAACVL